MNNVASNVSARNLLATCSDYLGNFFQILPTLRFVFKIKYAEASSMPLKRDYTTLAKNQFAWCYY